VLVALSGGPDSVVLFDLFCQIRDELDLTIFAAHYNHGLRGEEADDDEQFVRKLCRKYDKECLIERGNAKVFAKKNKLSIEHAARILRYEFLEQVADSVQADVIATGHNADDQAETILDRLMRGTGISGFQGIPMKRGKIIRPLLTVYRKDIMAYIHERALEYRMDSSNEDVQFRRNMIRHQLLPLLKQKFNPQIVPTLNRLGNIFVENESFLLSEGRKGFERCLKIAEKDKIVLDILCFLTYFRIIQKYIIILGLEELGVPKHHVNFNKLEQIIHNIEKKRSGKSVKIGVNHQVLVAGDEIVLLRDDKILPRTMISVDLQRGIYPLWNGWVLGLTILDREKIPAQFSSDKQVELVDMEKLVSPVRVRTMQEGDRFFPVNMKGSKKLSDFFIDERIQIYKRHQIPILESDNKIVWICGLRLDDRFKVTNTTKKVVRLQITREGDATK